MFLNSVIISLREVLEAAFIISILLFLSRRFLISSRWSLIGVSLGLVFSILYGINIRAITNSYDGLGQEILNAAMQLLIYSLLLAGAYFTLTLDKSKPQTKLSLQVLYILVTTFAISREGSEIYLYISAFRSHEDILPIVFSGSFLGAGIGFSVGALLFFTLNQSPRQYTFRLAFPLMAVIAAGMCIQASQLLMQANVLPSGLPLWNTNNILSENTVAGQLLYAVVGYEASPSLIEVFAYASALVIFFSTLMAGKWHVKKKLGDGQYES